MMAWQNHLQAFGAGVAAGNTVGENKTKALDQIMMDYTENSVVRVFNNEEDNGEVVTHEGIAAIRTMFDTLFTTLDGCGNETANGNLNLPATEGMPQNPVVNENMEDNPGNVFLLWQCPLAGVDFATDTFIFTGNKIAGQNIVLSMPAAQNTVLSKSPSTRVAQSDYSPTSVQEAWNNHFEAFGDQNVSRILLDYTDESVVYTFEWINPKEALVEHRGLAAIEKLFSDLFARISDGTPAVATPVAPLVIERNETDALEYSVFLNWNARGAVPAITHATDTFIFGTDFKIKTQTVVTQSVPAQLAGVKAVVV